MARLPSLSLFPLLLLSIPFLLPDPARAGDLTPLWEERWASVDGRKDFAVDVVADGQGNAYVAGTSHFTPLVTYDIVIVSYAPDGTERWVDVYDGGSQDLAAAAVLEADGSLLVLGRSNGDFLVLRYDTATGERLNVMTHDASGIDDPRAIAVDPAGDLVITGSSWPDGSDNQNDYYTVKLDAAGNALWSARYNGPGAFLFAHDVPYDVVIDAVGDVYVTGSSNAPGSASGDFYTVKYDGATGAEVWSHRYSAGPNEVAHRMALDGDGALFVTGGSYQAGFKYVTLKYAAADGQVLWTAIDAPAACSVATELGLDAAGDVYVSGWADPDCDESNFNDDIVTVKHRSSDGVALWTASYGDPAVGHFDVPADLVIDAQDNVWVTGQNTGLLVLLRYDPANGERTGLSTIATGPDEIAGGAALALDPQQNVLVAGTARNFNTENRDLYTLAYGAAIPAMIFEDGFESGTLGAWAAATQ